MAASATLADPRWAIRGAGRRRRGRAGDVARLGAGGAAAAAIQDTASLAALIPAMLAAQTAAHLALLAAGAPAHPDAQRIAGPAPGAGGGGRDAGAADRRAHAAPRAGGTGGATAVEQAVRRAPTAAASAAWPRRPARDRARRSPPDPSPTLVRSSTAPPHVMRHPDARPGPPGRLALPSGSPDETGGRTARAAGAAAGLAGVGAGARHADLATSPGAGTRCRSSSAPLVLTFDQQIRPVAAAPPSSMPPASP